MSVVPDSVRIDSKEVVAKSFVRLAPTTLMLAPSCFGDYEKVLRPVDFGIPSSEDACKLCSVRSQCEKGQGVEVKLVPVGSYD